MIAVDYHSDLKEVQLDARLAGLLSTAQQQAPFDRLEWLQGLVMHCGLRPLVAVARDADALAALPLAEEHDRLTGLANWYTFRFQALVSQSSRAKDLFGKLATELAERTSRITLTGVPDEEGHATLLQEAFRDAGWLVLRDQCDINHYLPVRGRSWKEIRAGLPGSLRTTLKRKSGKLDCRVLTHFDEQAWREYESIYGESWKPEEGSPVFLRAFAEQEGSAGRLRLGLACCDGAAVAAQMWTVEANSAFIHKLAHREEAKQLSPGSVLSAALFEHVIDIDKVDLIDFGTGDDPYKRDWMEEARPRYRLDMLRPFTPKSWLIFAKAGLRRLAGRDKRG